MDLRDMDRRPPPRVDPVSVITAACWGAAIGIALAAYLYEPALQSHLRNAKTVSEYLVGEGGR